MEELATYDHSEVGSVSGSSLALDPQSVRLTRDKMQAAVPKFRVQNLGSCKCWKLELNWLSRYERKNRVKTSLMKFRNGWKEVRQKLGLTLAVLFFLKMIILPET